jgi:hypothetical protein
MQYKHTIWPAGANAPMHRLFAAYNPLAYAQPLPQKPIRRWTMKQLRQRLRAIGAKLFRSLFKPHTIKVAALIGLNKHQQGNTVYVHV